MEAFVCAVTVILDGSVHSFVVRHLERLEPKGTVIPSCSSRGPKGIDLAQRRGQVLLDRDALGQFSSFRAHEHPRYAGYDSVSIAVPYLPDAALRAS